MNRRELLKLVAIGGAGTAMGIGSASFSRAIASETRSEWGYVGQDDPSHWGELSAEYQACKIGAQQSPINLQEAIDAELSPIQINYQPVPLRILNNGHTIQVNATPGNQITIDGTPFELLQFHFHHPSEHTLMGQAYPMELHLVHKSEAGELAVLGVFLQAGQENAALKPIWDAMPEKPQPEKAIAGVTVPIASLLPAKQDTYRYYGSLTTPPCSETVRWMVFGEPIQVSQAQIDKFAQVFSLNARPVQPINRRYLLHSQP
jgi:carbonic anhydrase